MVTLGEAKDPYYLPHLTWPEVADHLRRSTTAILPFGALEQHGPALPLGTDTLGVIAVARAAARETGALVVPVVFPGLSSHHMGFPGTVTLGEETFARVVMDAAASLARHGFRRLVLSNGHGGNEATLGYLAYRITRETPAHAMLFGIAELRKIYLTAEIDKLDIHAGIGETSSMLYQQPALVRREAIERPRMRLDPWRERLLGRVREDPSLLRYVTLGLPAVHECSSNGCITYGDPARASVERGKELFDAFVAALAAFIKAWEEATA
ncbi:MAG: creatininase family protein [Armatimonadota bacterium]|nr:creatininase family protein [Armatimonadota bacterium]MDR7422216.1 creatininase family protein [Armatimonadota bacterium]MDR7454399.1 creatininase family protein [Armatimonadota bacterium]MDR7457958.1 creatininase family protein [Armatimonadota bacterium]MDR7495761.1 creatininase family protein [Armatimonadota bacterium]